ncbi:uncharacterized protein LOC119173582 isoform X4 [Rhipicephalus microplus]|uniref:uncharacterized protein LOC119173582 isoform X4 n=1 Tax=Rhipicephalus microplus TaxID=6941 RepID=UPI003F6D7BB8
MSAIMYRLPSRPREATRQQKCIAAVWRFKSEQPSFFPLLRKGHAPGVEAGFSLLEQLWSNKSSGTQDSGTRDSGTQEADV